MKTVTRAMLLIMAIMLAVAAQPVHFVFKANTGGTNTMIIGVRTSIAPVIGEIPLTTGDEIGVFVPGGLCVGAVVWDGVANKAITVWGDDPQTGAVDGATAGQSLTLRVWDASAAVEFFAAVTLTSGTLTFAANTQSVLASLSGIVPPEIVVQPISKVIYEGELLELSLTARGTALAYQWYHDGAAVVGLTSFAIAVTGASSAYAGTWFCKISNTVGIAISDTVVVTVKNPIKVVSHPVDRTVTAGDKVTFGVRATVLGSRSYQWFKNGSSISTATDSVYAISVVAVADAGTYYCEVSSGSFKTRSNSAILSVLPVPAIPAPPHVYLTRTAISVFTDTTITSTALNDGDGVLPDLSASVSGAAAWLTAVVDNSPVNAATLAVTVRVAGLAAGTHSAIVTVTGAPNTQTVSVSVSIGSSGTRIPSSIVITPVIASCAISGSIQFGATVYDQFGLTMVQSVSWAASEGSGTISATGLLSASGTPGSYAVQASVASLGIRQSASFNIRGAALTLLSPDGSEVLQTGQDVAIEWAADTLAIDSVGLDLSLDGGISWLNNITGPKKAATGLYRYSMPVTVNGISTLSAQAKIRIVSKDRTTTAMSVGVFSIVAPVSQTVAVTGGTVELPGAATIVIPADARKAADVAVPIQVVETRTTVAPPAGLQLEGSGDVFLFLPHGSEFDKPVTVSLPYSGSKSDVVILRRTSESTPEWEVITGFWFDDDNAPGIVFFKISHFSVYALAARENMIATSIPTTIKNSVKTFRFDDFPVTTLMNAGALTVINHHSSPAVITLVRVDGAVVHSFVLEAMSRKIVRETQFGSGIYFIQVKSNNKSMLQRSVMIK